MCDTPPLHHVRVNRTGGSPPLHLLVGVPAAGALRFQHGKQQVGIHQDSLLCARSLAGSPQCADLGLAPHQVCRNQGNGCCRGGSCIPAFAQSKQITGQGRRVSSVLSAQKR